MFLLNEITIIVTIFFLFLLYLSRSITGGFIVSFGYAKDLYYEYIITRNVFLSQHQINNKIHLKYYESSPMFNLITRAKNALTSGALRQTINTVGSFLTLILSLTAMIGTMFILNPIYALISTVSVIPIFIKQLIFADKFMQMNKKIIEKKRRQEQFINQIIGKDYFLETRISGASDYFQRKWENYRKEIADEEMSLQYSRLKYDLLLNLIKAVSVVGVIVLASLHMAEGKLSIGGFSAVIGMLSILQSSTIFFINQISNISAHYKELKEVIKYYELEKDKNIDNFDFPVETIQLDNISFKYPSRDEYAVRDICLQFKKGEKIAILGVNGAGKTTLINLILGLYNPTEGKIYYNEKNLETINKKKLYKNLSSVMQDFNVYNLTIKENVIFGDIDKIHKSENIYEALDLAGFNYEKYNKKADTVIGREFNGIELSRGENQQIAIARSYYNKNSEIVIIDEPTAALDPIAEEKLYKEFLKICGNKTTFIVSHRLGSVKIADRIIVMDSSSVIEDGTHEELLKNKGLYYKMYKEQKKLYNR